MNPILIALITFVSAQVVAFLTGVLIQGMNWKDWWDANRNSLLAAAGMFLIGIITAWQASLEIGGLSAALFSISCFGASRLLRSKSV
jgi:hypothetical protein